MNRNGVGVMVAALVLPVALGTTGCKRGAGRPYDEGRLPMAVLQFARPHEGLTYTRKRVVGKIPLPDEVLQQSWTRVTTDHYGVHYDVATQTEPGSGVVQRYRYGSDGVVLAAEGPLGDGGEILWEPWIPPAVVLPPDPAAEPAWEQIHKVGLNQVERSCEVQRSSPLCDGAGLVVVCDGQWPEFRLITRDHFCEQSGWSGYESLVVRPDSPSVRTWTEDVRRNRDIK